MDRSEWEEKLTCFQACARGFLVRREVRSAREDFENIVREIDGNLTHLEWRQTKTTPTPHFTDTDGPLTQPCRPPNPGLSVSISPQRQSSLSPEEEAHQHLPERIEAERDGSPGEEQRSAIKERFLSSSTRKEVPDGEVTESTGDSTNAWSSVELDMNCDDPCKGTQQYRSVQEVPRTPEDLRLHRNTLTMELLWLQQAIESRKKYLSLKNRLSVS
ncbi:IQ domain-containing protein C [Halichoeres trimaculatus]|uniref:IQ domain-containing protein C n=1 Tax=Halichoeres trimaculatus TaxID=147232 RepID=UPI003D9F048A